MLSLITSILRIPKKIKAFTDITYINPIKNRNSQAFDAAKEKIIGKSHNDKGIGTLSEKTLHAVLKMYYEPDEDNHDMALADYLLFRRVKSLTVYIFNWFCCRFLF